MEGYDDLRVSIYHYCDNHVNEEVLLPRFSFFYSPNGSDIDNGDIVSATSGIVDKLLKDGVLKEVQKKEENVYPMYKIMPHKDLVGKKFSLKSH